MLLTKKASIDDYNHIDDNYWSTEPILHTYYYSSVMPRNPYRIIYRFQRFSDPNKMDSGNRNSRLIELDAEILNLCRSYQPSPDLSLDETILLHN